MGLWHFWLFTRILWWSHHIQGDIYKRSFHHRMSCSLLFWLPKDPYLGNLTNLTVFTTVTCISTNHIHRKLSFCTVFFIWCIVYYNNYSDSTDIQLNQNSGRKVPFAHSPGAGSNILAKMKKIIYYNVWISFIYFRMQAKAKNHTLLTMGVTAKSAHRREFRRLFPINRMLAHFSSVVGWNLVETRGFSILLCTIY
jgi:hypothetical protein